MKRTFATLVLNRKLVPGVDTPTCVPPVKTETPAIDKLVNMGRNSFLQAYTEKDLVGPPPNFMGDREFPIQNLPADTVLLIGGNPTPEQLREAVVLLAGRDQDFILVVDAFENPDELRPLFVEWNEGLKHQHNPPDGGWTFYGVVQLSVVGALSALVKQRRHMMYAYPKTDSTTTTVVLIDAGTPDAKVLRIVRDRNPFKDFTSLPGGFLNVHLESLPACAARELGEECHLHPKPEELVLIDVRSNPDRDVRGHVIDHGYAWFVPADQKAAVLAAVKAGDDAKPGSAGFVPVDEVLSGKIAFDHEELLRAALKRVPAASPAK